MTGFDKWYNYVTSEGKLWPSFGRYDTEVELIAAKEAWKAALKWVREEEKICGPLYTWIEEELNGETEK